MKAYSGKDLDGFWKAAGLDKMASRSDVLGLHHGNALKTRPKLLRVLHVIDSGTTGLTGDPTLPTSKLRKLLMEIGGSQKLSEGATSGGSYGFGKAVYSASSRIAVIFAYSRTENAAGQPMSILMGCAYHQAHEFAGKRTSGRGFFGMETKLDSAVRYDAFTGVEADRLAEDLNMERAENDIGTTIAIVDCPLSMEDIKRGVERSWWPKLRRDNFRVKLIDEVGQRLYPRPLQDPDLRPFVEAFDVALGRSPVQSGKSRRKIPSIKEPSKQIGQLGLFVMIDSEEADEQTEKEDLRDTIALVRSPGMVVQYYGKRGVNHPPVAGVFLADERIDEILRRCEPPEHNRWDARADRLDPAQRESEIVRKLHDAIWRDLRSFQRSARPSEKSADNRFRQLERDLTKLFGPTDKREPGGEGRGKTPVSLRPNICVKQMKNDLKIQGRVAIELKEDHGADLPVVLTMRLSPIDESHRRLDPISITASFENTTAKQKGKTEWYLTLSPGETVNVKVESAAYEPDWTVEFMPQIKPLNGKGVR